MKKLQKFTIATLLIFIMCFSLAACGQDGNGEDTEGKTKIKVGCLPTTEFPVQCLKEVLADKGYEVEIVMFEGNNMPATALRDGDIDGLIGNHYPWIKTFSEENNCELVMVEPYYYYSPFSIYSTKYKSLDELPDGAQIVIPNDPANTERSLIMLQDLDLIKLGEKTEPFYSLLDVIENKKNIEFVGAEMTATARNAQDVDAVFAAAMIAQGAGLDPNEYLYMDPTSESKFPVGLVVNAKDKDAEWATEGMKLVKSDEMKAKFDEKFKGAFRLYE